MLLITTPAHFLVADSRYVVCRQPCAGLFVRVFVCRVPISYVLRFHTSLFHARRDGLFRPSCPVSSTHVHRDAISLVVGSVHDRLTH
jgi:hypothetical protein